MKYVLSLFIFFLVLTNCNKQGEDVSGCNVEDPIEELNWLKEMKNSLSCVCHESIAQGLYKGQTVFYLVIPSFYCDAAGITLWDCNGDIVKVFRYVDEDPDIENIELVEIIYSCD